MDEAREQNKSADQASDESAPAPLDSSTPTAIQTQNSQSIESDTADATLGDGPEAPILEVDAKFPDPSGGNEESQSYGRGLIREWGMGMR